MPRTKRGGFDTQPEISGGTQARPDAASDSSAVVQLGCASAIELASRGADLVLVCRDPARGAGVLEEVRKAGPAGSHRLLVGDLADPEAVRALAAQIRQDSDQLHALIHTAAALTRDRQENRRP
jgi:NAD(P)-dependent dehydrogenase (short-subunit alcohol dehydrogenase family)